MPKKTRAFHLLHCPSSSCSVLWKPVAVVRISIRNLEQWQNIALFLKTDLMFEASCADYFCVSLLGPVPILVSAGSETPLRSVVAKCLAAWRAAYGLSVQVDVSDYHPAAA